MGLQWATALGAAAVVGGFTAQNVTIVYWLQSDVSSYAVLLLCGLVFAVFFVAAAAAFAARTRDWSVFSPSDDAREAVLLRSPWRRRGAGFRLTHAQLLVAAGLCNSLNGVLIVFASSSVRTPPLVQAILQNACVLFSVPFSKAVLGDTKRYCAPEPLRAAGVVVASVVVSLAPTVAAVASGRVAGDWDGLSSLGWCAIYLAGLAPAALLAVLQQLYFIRTGALREGATPHEQLRGTLRALMFSNCVQPLAYAALFWVDLLPWFGTSSSAADFVRVTRFSLACSVGGPALVGASSSGSAVCQPYAPVWAWAFIGAYIAAYFGGARLNRESATFNMLCLVVVTATTSLVWLIPGVNPNEATTPLWSVLVSLALSLLGSALWKQWEARTPAAAQFSVLFEEGEDGSGHARLSFMGDGMSYLSVGGGDEPPSRGLSLTEEDYYDDGRRQGDRDSLLAGGR